MTKAYSDFVGVQLVKMHGFRMQLNSLGIEMFHGRNSHHVSKPYSTGTISKNSLHAGLISLLVYLYQTRFSTKLLCSLMVLG